MPAGRVPTARRTVKTRSTDWTPGTPKDLRSADLVGHLALPAGDEGTQFLIHGVVDRRRLVAGQQRLPDAIGPLTGVQAAVLDPLLEAGVVGHRGAIEGGLEVGQGVGGTEEMLTGAVVPDG